MKIIAAKKIGFCAGGRRAIGIARHSLEKDQKPIQLLGEIIHNEEVLKEIKKKGGRLISDPRKAKSGTLIIRAHGFPPFRYPKNLLIRDATCPLVKKAQEAGRSLSKEGYRVVIIGEKNHPEVKGIQGYIKGKSLVIGNERQAKRLKNLERIGVIAQTTQNLERVKRILKILKTKAKELKWVNTLCPEVASRQEELSEVLKEANGVLVIGSATSSNTNQLTKIIQKSKKPVWQINCLNKLKKVNFNDVRVLGVVSGTSTPDREIERIKKWLEKKQR